MLVAEKNVFTQEIEKLVKEYGGGRQTLLPVLQAIQKSHGHISDYAMQEIARILDIHPVEVYGMVSFFSFLRANDEGKYVVKLCRTVSCNLAGKEAITRTIERELGIKFGETTPDGKFTLKFINCMGMCDQGPAMLINDEVHTHLTPHSVVDILNECK